MKILPGVSVSRVVECCTAMEGCQCTREKKRTWVKPYFGVRLGRHWFFPIGTGMRMNTADKIRENAKWFLWVLGITGWIQAAKNAFPWERHPGPREGCPRCATMDAEPGRALSGE